ncbi:MAG TPA: hypothetical protein VKP69_03820 [Isosphaeraceae bacterium]|nr:hypothetical protein [Isosphaeraceae bacterium]
MPDTRIVNASPLIFLGRAGLLEVLRTPPRRVIVPVEVRDEVCRRGLTDPTARAVDRADWLEVVPSPGLPESVLAWGLGRGGSAVAAVARKPLVEVDQWHLERITRATPPAPTS